MENNHWFRTYLFIWAGQFVSMISSYSVHFAVIIWLSLEHQSAEVLALAGIAGLLPQAVIGPFAGVFIDRWNRKLVMILADAFIALCTLVMVFVMNDGDPNLGLVYFLLGCRSVGNAFHSPAMQAIAPLIVPEKELLRVSGINQMLQSVSGIAGPALGTIAITYLPIAKVLYIDIVGALVAITSLFFVSIPHLKREKTKPSLSSVITELKEGMHAVYYNKGLAFLFLFAMIATFFIMPVAIMFPLLTTGHYAGGKWEMGLIEIIWGVGMLIGGSILGIMRVKTSKIILVNTMHIILGLTFSFSGLLPGAWFLGFVTLTAFGGVALSIFSAAFMTILQEEVAADKLGRVFSLYFSMAVLPSIVGLLFTGIIAENIGVAYAFVISGILVTLVGVVSFLVPSLMKLGSGKTD